MGSPGKIKSTLQEDQLKGLVMSAHHYVENYKRFKKELKKVGD
jgi:carbonic anhydrase/acetyltransferase-like protein (isoleucine patch superfamily)